MTFHFHSFAQLSIVLPLPQRGWRRATLALALLVAILPVARHADAADPVLEARAQSPITVSLQQFKVSKQPNGDVKFVDASLVVPGDVLEYRASYTNRGKQPLLVVATLPVPESVEYVKESAKAKGPYVHSVALKDGQFTSEPIMEKMRAPSGATLLQAVPYAAYRSVRWDLGSMAPNTTVEVSIRAMVSDSVAAPAAN